jgi:hypothetical protein
MSPLFLHCYQPQPPRFCSTPCLKQPTLSAATTNSIIVLSAQLLSLQEPAQYAQLYFTASSLRHNLLLHLQQSHTNGTPHTCTA